MPKVDRYLDGFGLAQNSYLEGYYLTNISVGHDSIKRYREYSYPTRLVWSVYDKGAHPETFKSSLKAHLSQTPTIYTRYGNPYKCNFGELSFDTSSPTQIVVTSTGSCTRI